VVRFLRSSVVLLIFPVNRYNDLMSSNADPSSKPIAQWVDNALQSQPVTDIHTHCFAPAFGSSPTPDALLLWGIDELVTYHYLIAEVYRVVPVAKLPYDQYWKMSKIQQADHIWKNLFVDRTPLSEACRGVLTTLSKLGLDPNEPTLAPYRQWFKEQNANDYVDKVMQIANVDSITMTNEVFHDGERAMWLDNSGVGDDPRFTAVLRVDPLLQQWPSAASRMRDWGYDTQEDFSGNTANEVRRFLNDWLDRMKAIYVAMSLPPEFMYPDQTNSAVNSMIRDCLMPVLADRGLPWAMMIGAKRRDTVNPDLHDAGDSLAKADVQAVTNLCRDFPDNKFLVTMLSRENQHELCVTARKFGNLMVFGCWWFLNNPSLIEEITRMRMELLGPTFISQHSDARILDQLIYKWDHSRRIIGKVLIDKYLDLAQTGFDVTNKHIQRDVALLLRDNFRNFLAR
jgi:hypothetical protein